MEKKLNLIAFAASNNARSINRKLIDYAVTELEAMDLQDLSVDVIDINDFAMPIFSIDLQNEHGIHELARDFFEKIGKADALLISFAEHNGHYPAAYKNLFDWASRIDKRVYQDKPCVFMAASPGPGGGKSVLGAAMTSAPFFGANLLATFSLPDFFKNFDPKVGQLVNEKYNNKLRAALATLDPALSLGDNSSIHLTSNR